MLAVNSTTLWGTTVFGGPPNSNGGAIFSIGL